MDKKKRPRGWWLLLLWAIVWLGKQKKTRRRVGDTIPHFIQTPFNPTSLRVTAGNSKIFSKPSCLRIKLNINELDNNQNEYIPHFLIFFSSLCFWGSKPFGGWMRLVGHCGWASFVACKWDAAAAAAGGWMELCSFPTYQKKKNKKKKVCFFLISRPFISQSSENRWLIYDRTDGLGECPCICHLHLFTTRQEKQKNKK